MNKLSTKSFVILTLLFVFAVGTVLFGMKNGWFEPGSVARLNNVSDKSSDSKRENRPDVPSLAESLNVDPDDITSLGGVDRPKRDVNFSAEVKGAHKTGLAPVNPLKNAGRLPRLSGDENPQVAGLLKE